ncbi:MAG TPA: exodeoxyribonuclease VII large subunit [bacterium]|nr:exodeoxyribonuclease VII large subunit [bacterium]HPN43098.1 exodeoxyribonuclease VII large subunit [bacterium]
MDLSDTFETTVIYSVSEINLEIKEILETTLPPVWVQGEISNFVHHSSGHMYFSLKDPNSQISCVLWKSRNLSLHFAPTDGMKVNVLGAIRVYEKRGTYQIDVVKMLPSGIGDLQLAFEKLKKRLHEEGLFDEQYKKSIPRFPTAIGIVTSQTGAAIRDIKNVIQRRFPSTTLILRPTVVQGDGAGKDIARAIDEFNEYGQVDVLIVGRGGGSLEDLWAFNEEQVARAIFRSKIPVISAVGHEIDYTISDFVADLRAPTPSAAAELVVPDINEIQAAVSDLYLYCRKSVQRILNDYRDTLHTIKTSYGFRRPQDFINQHRQRLDELIHICSMASFHKTALIRQQLQRMQYRLTDLNPASILKRGYSICRRASDQTIIKNAVDVDVQEQISVELAQGRLTGIVTTISRE